MGTGIEWTDETWNPTTGCDKVSPGCDHCYAMTLAPRLKAMGSAHYQTDGNPETSGPGFGLAMHPDALDKPLRWTRPRLIFVNSMSDLFHPGVTRDFQAQVFAVMALAPRHTFQVLTKRPGVMRSVLSSPEWQSMVAERVIPLAARNPRALETLTGWGGTGPWPLPNVWLGTSVEDQKRADLRIPPLLETPAAVRFLSMEPLLGPVDLLGDWTGGCEHVGPAVTHEGTKSVLEPGLIEYDCEHQAGIDWVIVGGESGKGARPMHPGWVRSLRDQCTSAGMAFHFKQWGNWAEVPPSDTDTVVGPTGAVVQAGRSHYQPGGGWVPMVSMHKKAAGRELDGRTWDEFPVEVASRG